jgi:hypothetical protein
MRQDFINDRDSPLTVPRLSRVYLSSVTEKYRPGWAFLTGTPNVPNDLIPSNW